MFENNVELHIHRINQKTIHDALGSYSDFIHRFKITSVLFSHLFKRNEEKKPLSSKATQGI